MTTQTADAPRRGKTHPPSKNRVWDFFEATHSCTQENWQITQCSRLENQPTPTTTASGVPYYGLRYYNPELGRWVNRDPIGERGGRNLYSFVLNDPCSLWDILGLIHGIDDVEETLPDGSGRPHCIELGVEGWSRCADPKVDKLWGSRWITSYTQDFEVSDTTLSFCYGHFGMQIEDKIPTHCSGTCRITVKQSIKYNYTMVLPPGSGRWERSIEEVSFTRWWTLRSKLVEVKAKMNRSCPCKSKPRPSPSYNCKYTLKQKCKEIRDSERERIRGIIGTHGGRLWPGWGDDEAGRFIPPHPDHPVAYPDDEFSPWRPASE